MALRFSLYSPTVMTLSHISMEGPRNSRVVVCADNAVSVNLRIKSSDLKKKVFEDRSAGIVCYEDENGEITCEGYDEGPRLHHQISNAEIMELLQRCWVHVAEGNELDIADKEIAGQNDFNCNGLNKIC